MVRRKRERDVGSAMGEEGTERERLCLEGKEKEEEETQAVEVYIKEKIVRRIEKEVDQIFLYLYLYIYIFIYYIFMLKICGILFYL